MCNITIKLLTLFRRLRQGHPMGYGMRHKRLMQIKRIPFVAYYPSPCGYKYICYTSFIRQPIIYVYPLALLLMVGFHTVNKYPKRKTIPFIHCFWLGVLNILLP